jgi:DNA invertase Pin-like site-specific DNA recombinase
MYYKAYFWGDKVSADIKNPVNWCFAINRYEEMSGAGKKMISITCASIYARYSSENQREASIEDQIRKCREFGKSKGWQVLEDHIYFDKAVSGKSIASREGFNALLEIALSKNPPFQYILVDDTSRVARNTREALGIFEELTARNIFVYYVSQGIDTKKETASEMITLHGMVDSLYIRELSKKTHRGIEGQVLKGFSGGGQHYGYRSKPVYGDKADRYGHREAIGYVLEIDPKEAETIVRILILFGQKGWSAKRIVNKLNKELKETGEPKPPRGEYWCVSTILGSKKAFRGILNNELFIGKYIWNKTTSKYQPKTGGKRMLVNAPETWSVVEKPELRIVSDELWNLVKKRQKEIKDKVQGVFNKAKHLYSENLLTKIALCGMCGGTFSVVSGGKYAKYGCSTNWNKGSNVCSNSIRIKKEILEEAIIATLCREFSKKDPMAFITSEIHLSLKKIMEDTVNGRRKMVIEEDLRTAHQELENISNAIKRGIITETTERLLLNAENMERELKNELLLFEIGNLDEIKLTEAFTQKDIEAYFARVVEGLTNPETTKETLYSIVDKVVVHCEKEVYVDIEIHESLKKTVGYIMDLIGKRDARIKLQTGTAG